MLGKGIKTANPNSVFQNFVLFVSFVVAFLILRQEDEAGGGDHANEGREMVPLERLAEIQNREDGENA